MAQALGTLAKWAIPLSLVVGGAQSAMYDGKVFNTIVNIHCINDSYSPGWP